MPSATINGTPGPIDLDALQTESRNQASADIDRVSTLDVVGIINDEDASVATAVRACQNQLALAIDVLTARVQLGGRVFYIGAGTSGRLGVLDASEIPPTYSAPPGQFVAVIAGGDTALRHAVENAEDDFGAAARDLDSLQFDPERDSLIGIAASGRTPYVLGGLAYAASQGATTIGVACVQPSAIEADGNASIVIAPITGPEVVTGSTRMKAGTATKMVLNIVSTGIMIKTGKTYGNLMIDVKATNLKLRHRANNILRSIAGAECLESDAEVESLLQDCDGSVKLAAATIILQKPLAQARIILEKHMGVLAAVIEEVKDEERKDRQELKVVGSTKKVLGKRKRKNNFVVAIDAGASSCKAVVMDSSGQFWMGQGPPCNVSRIGVDAALMVVQDSLRQALDANAALAEKPLISIPISHFWLGIAGGDRPGLAPSLRERLMKMVNDDDGETQIYMSTDADLIPSSLFDGPTIKSAVVLIAGTGSVAMSFQRDDPSFRFVRTARVGGWGAMLGDDGSGYSIGRAGLRLALAASDGARLMNLRTATVDGVRNGHNGHMDVLAERILASIRTKYPHVEGEPLDIILHASSALGNNFATPNDGVKNIAEFAETVMDAYPDSPAAKGIVIGAASALTDLVESLVVGQELDTSKTALVLAGGLMINNMYQKCVSSMIADRGITFSVVRFEQQPALAAAKSLNIQKQP